LIELEKKSGSVSLTVDGEVLCDAPAEVLSGKHGKWQCSFQLTGERIVDWEVYQTNVDGTVLDTTGEVRERSTFSNTCHVSFAEGVSEARLAVDGIDFDELPQYRELHNEQPLVCSQEAFVGSFGAQVPHKIDHSALAGLNATISGFVNEGGLFGFIQRWLCCCKESTEDVLRSEVVQHVPDEWVLQSP